VESVRYFHLETAAAAQDPGAQVHLQGSVNGVFGGHRDVDAAVLGAGGGHRFPAVKVGPAELQHPSGIRVAVRQEADKDTGRACGPEA
jgi:hypothetical protein